MSCDFVRKRRENGEDGSYQHLGEETRVTLPTLLHCLRVNGTEKQGVALDMFALHSCGWRFSGDSVVILKYRPLRATYTTSLVAANVKRLTPRIQYPYKLVSIYKGLEFIHLNCEILYTCVRLCCAVKFPNFRYTCMSRHNNRDSGTKNHSGLLSCGIWILRTDFGRQPCNDRSFSFFIF